MALIRTATAAVMLIVPISAFAASDQSDAGPVRAASEQVLSETKAEPVVAADLAIDAVREAGRESEILARASVSPQLGSAKSRAVHRAKPSMVRAPSAPQPAFGCSGSWCGRQFVLMLGVGY